MLLLFPLFFLLLVALISWAMVSYVARNTASSGVLTPRWRAGAKLFIWIMLGAVSLYMLFGDPSVLYSEDKKLLYEIKQLEKKLQHAPEDSTNWKAVANYHFIRKDYDAASHALGRVLDIEGPIPAVQVELAFIELEKNQQHVTPYIEKLLMEALYNDPNNIEALQLIGFIALQNADFKEALRAWRTMQGLLAPESEDFKRVTELIDELSKLDDERLRSSR